MNTNDATIEYNDYTKTPFRLYNFKKPFYSKDARDSAAMALDYFAKEFRITSPKNGEPANEIKTSLCGNHVFYQQAYNNSYISNAWIRVDVDHEERVFNIANS